MAIGWLPLEATTIDVRVGAEREEGERRHLQIKLDPREHHERTGSGAANAGIESECDTDVAHDTGRAWLPRKLPNAEGRIPLTVDFFRVCVGIAPGADRVNE